MKHDFKSGDRIELITEFRFQGNPARDYEAPEVGAGGVVLRVDNDDHTLLIKWDEDTKADFWVDIVCCAHELVPATEDEIQTAIQSIRKAIP